MLSQQQRQLFDELYLEHAERIRQFIMRTTSANYADAQDIQQQVYLVLLFKMGTAIKHENPVAYLYTIANNFIKHFRRDHGRKDDTEVSIELLPDLLDRRRQADDSLEGDLFIFPEWVTDRDRRMLELSYREQMPLKEIGLQFGLTYGSTRAHLSRLMKRLRDDLKK